MESEDVQIFGVGHGGRDHSDFLGMLVCYGIDIVVDVRTFAISRHHPQYSKSNLMHGLSACGIYYKHERALGGKKEIAGFDEKIRELAEAATEGTRICLLCAEVKPETCHRTTKLKPALLKMGVDLVELKDLSD